MAPKNNYSFLGGASGGNHKDITQEKALELYKKFPGGMISQGNKGGIWTVLDEKAIKAMQQKREG